MSVLSVLAYTQKNIDIEQADILAVKQCLHDCQRKLLTKGYNVTNIPTWGLNVMFNLKGATAGRAWKDKIR